MKGDQHGVCNVYKLRNFTGQYRSNTNARIQLALWMVRIDQKIKTILEGINTMLQEKTKYEFRSWLEDYDKG